MGGGVAIVTRPRPTPTVWGRLQAMAELALVIAMLALLAGLGTGLVIGCFRLGLHLIRHVLP